MHPWNTVDKINEQKYSKPKVVLELWAKFEKAERDH